MSSPTPPLPPLPGAGPAQPPRAGAGPAGSPATSAAGAVAGQAAAKAGVPDVAGAVQRASASGKGRFGQSLQVAEEVGVDAAALALASSTGVPTAVSRPVLRVGVKTAKFGLVKVAGIAVVVVVALLLGLVAPAVSHAAIVPRPASDSEDLARIPGDWAAALMAGQEASLNGGGDIIVPWTVLGGIAKNATDFGRCDPYARAIVDTSVPPGDSPDSGAATTVSLGAGRGAAAVVVPTRPRDFDDYTPQSWAGAMLAALGLPASDANVRFFQEWARWEGGHWHNDAWYNPINATTSAPGATSMNSVGVKAYTSWSQGIATVANQLRSPNFGYPAIVDALRNSDEAAAAQAMLASSWGTGVYQLPSGVTLRKGQVQAEFSPGTAASPWTVAADCTPPRNGRIGGEPGQGVGPFLLTPQAAALVSQQGGDPQDPTDAAEFLGQALAETAVQVQQDGLADWEAGVEDHTAFDPTDPLTLGGFWAAVVNSTPLIMDPASGAGDCTVPEGVDGVDARITYVWRCEAAKAGALYVVTGASVDSGQLRFQTAARLTGVTILAREARDVAYGWSQWGAAPCNNKAALAGVFPLTKQVAARFGAADRCDPDQNIAAAARAVISVESVRPEQRENARGPYQPMLGGWVNIPAAFGSDLDYLLSHGPAAAWRPSTACTDLIRSWLQTVLAGPTAADVFSRYLAGADADTAPTEQDLKAALGVAGSAPGDDPRCGVGALSSSYQTVAAAEAQALAQTAGVGTDAAAGLAAYLFATAEEPEAIQARWGVHSFVTRLSVSGATARTPAGSSDYIESSDANSIGARVAVFAAALGGFHPEDEPRAVLASMAGGLGGWGATPPTLTEECFTAAIRDVVSAAATAHPGVPLWAVAGQLLVPSDGDPGFRGGGRKGIAGLTAAQWSDAVSLNAADGSGDGTPDVFDPADAVGALMTLNEQMLTETRAVPGDRTDLMLAAFHTSPSEVARTQGVPAAARDYINEVRSRGQSCVSSGGTVTVPAGTPNDVAAMIDAANRYAGSGSNTWYHRCDRLACRVYGYATSGYESAKTHWYAMQAAGQARAGDRCPPLGAHVFWTSGTWGHISTVVQADAGCNPNKILVVSNDVLDHEQGRTGGVYIVSLARINTGWMSWGSYGGWAPPVCRGGKLAAGTQHPVPGNVP